MFSQDAQSQARTMGSMFMSFSLHGIAVGLMLLPPILLSKTILVQRNAVLVETAIYTPRPGDLQQLKSAPNTLHIPRASIIPIRVGQVNRIERGSLPILSEFSGLLVLSQVIAPMPPSIDYGRHGRCGCVLQRFRSHLSEAVPVKRVEPEYPWAARRAGIQGAVVVNARITTQGDVTGIVVLSGPEQLRDAAADAVRQWKYRPYVLDGKAVEIETTITINFVLKSPSTTRLL
jgi:TonB family protein